MSATGSLPPSASPANGVGGGLRPWSSAAPAPWGRGATITAGRIGAGVVIAAVWFVLFAYIPYRIVLGLDAHGFPTPLTADAALTIGTVLAVLAGFRHIAKPTPLWGPAIILTAVVGLAYIVLLLQHPVLTVAFGSFASFSLVYRTLLLVLALAPVLRIGSGVVVLLEDLARPGERVRIQFG